MIYDLRGTSGSGKSYVAHRLIEEDGSAEQRDDSDVEWGFPVMTFLPSRNLMLLGTYDTQCGGCDSLGSRTDQQYLCDLALKLSREHDVFLEGMLVSHTFLRWHRLALKVPDYRFRFLDTPLDTCIERVKARRKAKGNHRPYDPKNLVKDWHQDRKVMQKLYEAGHSVEWVNHQTSYEEVSRELAR